MRRNISALRRVAALLLCVLLACGAFAGCSQVEEIVSGVAATGEFPVEVNGVNIQSRPSRVVVLSPSLADVVLALVTKPSWRVPVRSAARAPCRNWRRWRLAM